MRRMIAYDTETTGLRVHAKDVMFAFATCDECGKTDVVRMESKGACTRIESLVGAAENGDVVLIMHNAKFDLLFTEKFLGRRFADKIVFHDTQIMSHMLRNDHHGHRLKDLAWELAGVSKDDESAVRRYAKSMEDEDYSKVPPEVMREYQIKDVRYRTMPLFLFFNAKLQQKQKLSECYEWERDVIVPTMRMEQRGFMIDRAKTAAIRDNMEADARLAMDEVESVYGRRINIGNNGVLRQVLYNEKRMPVIARTAKTQLPSIEKEVLEELYSMTKDPLLRLAVRYGSRRRGTSMLQSYLDLADENGVIHPSIRTLGAVTGRESCSDPNLQNVEKEGRLKNPFPTPARRCFRPRPGFVNFHVDYSGIELRLLVHYSKDPELVAEVSKPDGDPHLLAGRIFYPPFTEEERRKYKDFCAGHPTIAAGIDAFPPDSDEWNALRDPAKGTNFAVPYGAGWQKAAVTLGLPLELGQYRFEKYRNRFPNLCRMTQDVSDLVRSTGGVSTQFGRFLHVPKTKAYIGTNYLIQGTAAEILKRAQVRVHRYLEDATGGECGLLLPIHDELVIEWPRSRLGEAKHCWRKIRELMIDFPQFDVPLDVKVDVSTVDWSRKTKFKFLGDAA